MNAGNAVLYALVVFVYYNFCGDGVGTVYHQKENKNHQKVFLPGCLLLQ